MTIRVGPAASPRWFNQDLNCLREYVDLIAEAGGDAIELVLFPGHGSHEIGRFHLLQRDWHEAVQVSMGAGLEVHAHAPLPQEFRLAQWTGERDRFQERMRPVLGGLGLIEAITGHPPTFVVHAAGEDADATASALDWMRKTLDHQQSHARIALELRAPAGPEDDRFDRDLDRLGAFVDRCGVEGVGICWDVAHDWEINGSISRIDHNMLARIFHVHLHDSQTSEAVHAPLDTGEILWRDAIAQLRDARWDGSITLEIRYRYAMDHGDPWSLLRSNLRAVRHTLTGE